MSLLCLMSLKNFSSSCLGVRTLNSKMSKSFKGMPTLRLDKNLRRVLASSATQCIMGLMASM